MLHQRLGPLVGNIAPGEIQTLNVLDQLGFGERQAERISVAEVLQPQVVQMRKIGLLQQGIQIVQPRNGLRVGAGSIEVKGIAIPGSKVFVNGTEATMDKAFRFSHAVALRPGTNYIRFRVVVPRRGSSFYIRRVVR